MSDLVIKENRRSKKIFIISISCFFLTMLIANFTLIYLATSSTNGLVNDNPYKYGINYNETLDMKRYQHKIGYKTSLDYNNNVITINISDKNGPIKADKDNLTINMFHPINKNLDFTTNYKMGSKDGTYLIENIEFPLNGEWEARVNLKHDGRILKTRHRFTVE